MDRDRVESEIDRYCVLPGQACSYKVSFGVSFSFDSNYK